MSAVRQLVLIDTAADSTKTPPIIAGNVTGASGGVDTSYLHRKGFYVATTGFTGTLDLQISFDGGTTWINALYTTRGTSAAAVNTQLSYAADTAKYIYLTSEHAPLMRVDMTRTVGSVVVLFFGNENSAPLANMTLTVDTELPAAAALADATANPTLPSVGAFPHGFNGTTWDRLLAGAVANKSGAVGILNALLVAIYNSAAPTITDGRYNALQLDVNGNLQVNLNRLLAGEYYTENVLAVVEQTVASANFGPTQYTYWAGAVTKANIKASAGNVWGLVVFNTNAAVRYFQLHNKASAPAAAETPLQSWPVPAGTANNPGVLLLDRNYLQGLRYGTGIGWAISTTLATFTDSATASEHSTEVLYK